MTKAIDQGAFRTEIYWSRLAAAVDEAAFALMRTAFSGVVRENLDFACGLFDARGRLLVQDRVGTPGLAGPMPGAMRHFLEAFPASIVSAGDVFITNDPWMVSGHRHDTTVLTPIFHGSNLVGWAMCVAHQIDVGGRGMTMESRDVFEEGIGIRPTRLFSAGESNQTLWDMIADNVRFPEMVLGDIRAQLASNDITAKQLLAVLADLGDDGLTELANSIIERTRATTRSAIAQIADGDYSAELPIEWPGNRTDNPPIKLAVTIRVRGEEIVVDYTGTSPQVDMAFNSPLNGLTTSYTLMALKCVLDPEMPMNDGFMAPITITAPEGSLLNPSRPAPVRGRNYLSHLVPELLFAALQPAVPDKVIAASGTAPAWNQQIEGTAPDGRRYAHFFPVRGGLGARPTSDGVSCISFPTNVSTLQVEVLESDAPILVKRKEMLIDSAGPGTFRGGLGQHVTLAVDSGDHGPNGPIYLGIQGGRLGNPIPGFADAGAGSPGRIVLNGEDIKSGKLWKLQSGDTVEYITPGGGGYGSPLQRDPNAVLADVLDEMVSVTAASEDYSVVIRDAAIDDEATVRLREG